GRGTTASTRNFHRRGENAIQYANGKPISISRKLTHAANFKLRRIAVQLSTNLSPVCHLSELGPGTAKPYRFIRLTVSGCFKNLRNSQAAGFSREDFKITQPWSIGGYILSRTM